ncbi:MAG: bifunctional phosphoribosylaminoimidazolecarboxamide formyltransferase/IMP cyclohydrolase, partial [Ghiorsea sp.]|nr:bifunctional phosphoribosylaminoimidazolecarboxamide formyltransferase/IMP cyclohydrolase [Ghiorsea sp.]
ESTAWYDRAISNYFAKINGTEREYPQQLTLSFNKQDDLRYGENPHQTAAFYVEPTPPAASIAGAEQLHGKALSYNNVIDVEAAFAIAREFKDPAAVVIKHTNPCGCAIGTDLAEAFVNAYAGDPISAFGSILGFNRTLDVATAELLAEPGRFVEAIIAPGYEEQALEILRTKPKWKNNVRLLQCPAFADEQGTSYEYRKVSGGLLVQQRDDQSDPESEYKVVTDRTPTDAELLDLKFAWKVCKHVKSNAILFAKNGMVVGVGAGQMSRLDSSFIACHKAGERSQGAVVASDAFFPFRDGLDAAAGAGISAVIQPGGSMRDDEVIAAADEHGLTMVYTGIRHFRH